MWGLLGARIEPKWFVTKDTIGDCQASSTGVREQLPTLVAEPVRILRLASEFKTFG